MPLQPLDEVDGGSVHPLTIEEYAALELAVALRPRLPEDFEVQMDVDVDLQLALPDEPASSRRPDLIVVRATPARVCGPKAE